MVIYSELVAVGWSPKLLVSAVVEGLIAAVGVVAAESVVPGSIIAVDDLGKKSCRQQGQNVSGNSEVVLSVLFSSSGRSTQLSLFAA